MARDLARDEKYQCPKCRCKRVYMRQTGKHCGLYCSDCNSWIKWLTKTEIMMFQTGKKDEAAAENKAYKYIQAYNGKRIMKCSECNTRLFDSSAPSPVGQFDLLQAKFCPYCGKEFM